MDDDRPPPSRLKAVPVAVVCGVGGSVVGLAIAKAVGGLWGVPIVLVAVILSFAIGQKVLLGRFPPLTRRDRRP